MIPYPSGKIHIGHSRNYIINDIFNRFYNSINYKCYMNMGWDGFGTPAENASILNNLKPLDFLKINIFYMKKQIKYIYFSIYWDYDLKTFDLFYYYVNQIFFLKNLKKKNIYLSNKKVYWDGFENNVLSNEQIIKGKGWRSGKEVSKINILTYYFKITKYKKELLNEINNLDWSDKIKIMQSNWIVSKNFILHFFYINFFLKFLLFNNYFFKNLLYYFFFAFFKSLKINFLLNKLKYFFKYNFLLNKGFFLKDLFFYFYEFWNSEKYFNYKNVFQITFFVKKGYFIFLNFYFKNTNFFDFYIFFNIKNIIFFNIKYKIKDWGFSRQRYWGCNIPTLYCSNCKKFFTLNLKKFFSLTCKNLKKNNLFYLKKVNNLNCSFCKNKVFKEIETFDTFVDSSWYYLKYFKNRDILNYKLPLDVYVGGLEHSTSHLLYSRYVFKLFRDIKYLNFGEPFKKFFCQGMVLYFLKKSKRIEKMSKSKNNVINPENLVLKYGVDSFRITILKKSLKKDFLWNSKFIFFGFNLLKKINVFFFYFIKIKDFFFFENFISKNLKIFYIFFYKNFKKIIFFIKKINYNNALFYLVKIINKKISKNTTLKKNIFFFKVVFFEILKIFKVFIPKISYFLILNTNFFKFKKIFYLKKIFKLILKKKNKKFFLILKNKKIAKLIIFNIFFKKKILNILFFKKKIKKIFLKKLINIRIFFNIILF